MIIIRRLEELKIGGFADAIQTTAYWPKYWEESWKLEGTCCHSNSIERPSVNVGVKNSQGVIITIIIASKRYRGARNPGKSGRHVDRSTAEIGLNAGKMRSLPLGLQWNLPVTAIVKTHTESKIDK